jgi:dTDP-4-amino-4,6-dideoxygalactose transaminase
MKMRYPLQTDNFTLWDRIKAAFFVLNKNNRLTTGPKVIELERKWEQISGPDTKCVAVSSGSTANHLLVETFIQSLNLNPKDITVFVPSTTWASSVSPWIMRGCKIVFVDINLTDFSFDYKELEKKLESAKNSKKVKVIWPTALIGFIPDIKKLNELKEKHNAYLFADLCETTMGEYLDKNILRCFDMATTSFFWAHQICGIEMGMLFMQDSFIKNSEFYINAQMIRSHGLTRVLPKENNVRQYIEKNNPDVDPEFLFYKVGTNYRTTDLNAFFALMDTERYYKYINQRKETWQYFVSSLPCDYIKPNINIVPFCLPIINANKDIKELKRNLNKNGWETRPIICFLPINPAFKEYAGNDTFPNSSFLNKNGFYVGLNKDISKAEIDQLISLL